MSEQADTHNPAKTEEAAIQGYRDLLKVGDKSSEFQNFADGMKKVLSVPKAGYKKPSHKTEWSKT